MKLIQVIFILLFVCVPSCYAQNKPDTGLNQPGILIFSKTARYHHESIPDGIRAIQLLGNQNGFTVDTTTQTSFFTDEGLKKYAALVFLSPSGELFDSLQKCSLQRYIRAGGGFVGIHAASTIDKNFTWYGHLVGAVFVNHPEPQTGIIKVVDRVNPATSHLPEKWVWKDEWYNLRDIQPDLHILLVADESSYKGGTNGMNHPVAWYHTYDGGRAFYTALGHFSAAYSNQQFLKHILAGIEYAIGKQNQVHNK